MKIERSRQGLDRTRHSSHRRTLVLALALGGLLAGSACSDDDDTNQSDAAAPRADAGNLDGGARDASIGLDGSIDLLDAAARDAASDAALSDAGAPGTLEYALAQLQPDMRTLIDQLTALNGLPIETLTPAQARMQPSIADAVKALLTRQGKSTAPEAVASATDQTIPGPAGTTLPIRVYKPAGATGNLPIIVYFHGGGWVIATVDTYDASARALANGAGAIVVSVEYRKGPEAKFPSAHDDAYAAYTWTLQNAAALGGVATRVAVAGESAGGNLAANVSIAARDAGTQIPVHQLLVYPVASADLTTPSYVEFANAKPLSKAQIVWFTDNYFRTMADGSDPRISLVNANLAGLPPTTIINAGVDVLRSDGENLAAKLKAAGNTDVVQTTYPGVTHEFFGTGTVVSAARDAVTLATTRLRASLTAP